MAHRDPLTATHYFDTPVTSEEVGIPPEVDEWLGFSAGGQSARVREARLPLSSVARGGVPWPAQQPPALEPRTFANRRSAQQPDPLLSAPAPQSREATVGEIAAPPLRSSVTAAAQTPVNWSMALGVEEPTPAGPGSSSVGGYSDPLFDGDAAGELLASLGLSDR